MALQSFLTLKNLRKFGERKMRLPSNYEKWPQAEKQHK